MAAPTAEEMESFATVAKNDITEFIYRSTQLQTAEMRDGMDDRTVKTDGQSGSELESKIARTTMMTESASTQVVAPTTSHSHQS